jgi:hypothetical protein
MFAIGGASLDDAPEDIEQPLRAHLGRDRPCPAVSGLIEGWHAAAPPRVSTDVARASTRRPSTSLDSGASHR